MSISVVKVIAVGTSAFASVGDIACKSFLLLESRATAKAECSKLVLPPVGCSGVCGASSKHTPLRKPGDACVHFVPVGGRRWVSNQQPSAAEADAQATRPRLRWHRKSQRWQEK
ncbi:uncharacterized protein LOC144132751 [Amblyomma americanum]